MPAVTPNQITTRFQRRINDLLRDFDELIIAVHGKHRQASLETMVAEQSVMLTAVLWESFINDLIIAYVVQEPRSCLADAQSRLRQSVGEKFAGIARWVSFTAPPRLSELQASKLLDPKGWNVSATSAQALAELANRHLDGVHARKFSLSAEDRQFVDYLVSLRNFLSHRSNASRALLQDSISDFDPAGPNGQLVAALRQFPLYLKQRLPGGSTRVNVIGRRVIDVAAKLA